MTKNTVGEQLSLFGLPRTNHMKANGGMRLMAEINEIVERPKLLGQSRREIKDD